MISQMTLLEGAPDLFLEVDSSPLSQTLDASTSMHQIENVTFLGVFDVMVYFEDQENSVCFSTSNQTSESNVSVFL